MTVANSAADSWAISTAIASRMIAGLDVGDYVWTWDDEDPSDQVRGEVEQTLRVRGLRLECDDRGARIEKA